MLYVSLKTKQDLDEQELMSNTFFCTWFWPGLLVQKPFAFYLFNYFSDSDFSLRPELTIYDSGLISNRFEDIRIMLSIYVCGWITNPWTRTI